MRSSISSIAALATVVSFATAGFAIINVWQKTVPAAANGDIQAVGDSIVLMLGIVVVFALGWAVYLIEP